MKPATSLPWETMIPRGRSIWGGETDKRVICDVKDYTDENEERQDAAYIVHACNAYPRLVKALRKCTETLGTDGQSISANNALSLLRELGELE